VEGGLLHVWCVCIYVASALCEFATRTAGWEGVATCSVFKRLGHWCISTHRRESPDSYNDALDVIEPMLMALMLWLDWVI
jgi:hypothetical protein